MQSSSFTAEIAMGNFDLGRLESSKICTVKAGMGNIGLTVDGKADDYTLDLQAPMARSPLTARRWEPATAKRLPPPAA